MIVAKRAGSPVEVLLIFLKLGLSCFGGPIAHIGYFRDEFVTRRRWLDEQAYADLVALCQFLPGPASSQVGFSVGLMRAGYLGGAAAWTGFTLPSAILLVLFAYGAGNLHGAIGAGLLHGLKLVAVAIVAQAVWGMARTLCPDRERASIAAIAALMILFSGSSIAQIGAITFGALAGLWLGGDGQPVQSGHVVVPVSRTVGVAALTIFLSCWPDFRFWAIWERAPAPHCSMRFTAPVRWSLAAGMWCCRFCAKPS
jgi:chromate transporter